MTESHVSHGIVGREAPQKQNHHCEGTAPAITSTLVNQHKCTATSFAQMIRVQWTVSDEDESFRYCLLRMNLKVKVGAMFTESWNVGLTPLPTKEIFDEKQLLRWFKKERSCSPVTCGQNAFIHCDGKFTPKKKIQRSKSSVFLH